VKKKKETKSLPKQAEGSKRGAAGKAHSTIGRKTEFKDKTIYNRKAKEIENDDRDLDYRPSD
jgi:hypothetical protein